MTDAQYLLDTNICIYILADAGGVPARRLGSATVGTVVTSTIVYAEVLRGIDRDPAEARLIIDRLFETVPPLPFDRAAADRYAAFPFRRAAYDRLIAAHALSLDLTFVTNNERDFADIPGLRVENWTR